MSGYTGIALGIARELTSEAIWHEGRCTWIGPVVERRSGRIVFAEHSLPPDLYGGTAGIGLVLAEVAALTGDRGCERTARAAARQSLATLDRIGSDASQGLFSGRAGVSLAAVRVGLLLQDGLLVERGRALAAGLGTPPASADRSYDLVAGRAGTIVALLAIGAAVDDVRLVEQAVRLGNRIVAAFDHRGAAAPRADEAAAGLEATGMAHGPSGVCCALLELWAATGDERYRDVADVAFAAEDRFFDEIGGNWTEGGGREERRGIHGAPRAMMSWCHGAPGIGLARHLAWRRTGDARRRQEASIAVEATERWTRAAMQSFRGGFSLCHGIAGNAEIVQECREAPDDGDGSAGLHADVCRWGASEFHARGLPWPDCASPSLMTGRAGVARFYLRAYDDELPLLLLPGPDWLR